MKAAIICASLLLAACHTGPDTNEPDPQPAVGRTFPTDTVRADTMERDFSDPLRNHGDGRDTVAR